MLYGDEVTLYKDGVAFTTKELQPIDVYPGSTCWGAWLTHRDEPNARPEDHVEHLFISPVPPASWPVAFRLRLRLRDRPGTIQAISTILQREHINILFAQSMKYSRHGAFWYGLCEATTLLPWANKTIQNLHTNHMKTLQDEMRTRSENERRQLANKQKALLEGYTRAISLMMTTFTERLCWLLRVADHEYATEQPARAFGQPIDQTRLEEILRDSDEWLGRPNGKPTLWNKARHVASLIDDPDPDRNKRPRGFLDDRFLYARDLIWSYFPLDKEEDERRVKQSLSGLLSELPNGPGTGPAEHVKFHPNDFHPKDSSDHYPVLTEVRELSTFLTQRQTQSAQKTNPAINDYVPNGELSDEDVCDVLSQHIRRRYSHHAIRAVDYQLCPSLLFARIHGRPRNSFARFRYDDKAQLLAPEDPALFEKHLEGNPPGSREHPDQDSERAAEQPYTRPGEERTGSVATPCKALACFSPAEHYVRIIPSTEQSSAKRVHIIIEYEAYINQQAVSPASFSTAGLLNEVWKLLQRFDLDVARLSNTLIYRANDSYDSSEQREVGQLHITTHFESSDMELHCLEATLKKQLNNTLSAALARHRTPESMPLSLTVHRVSIRKRGMLQLFLSTRFDTSWLYAHTENLIDEIDRVSANYGFEVITGNRHERITEQVMRQLSSADALLQVIPLLPSEAHPSDARLTWMVTEYAVATIREIPTIRILDVGRPNVTSADWLQQLQVDTELPVKTYRTYRQFIDQELPDALKILRDIVEPNPSG